MIAHMYKLKYIDLNKEMRNHRLYRSYDLKLHSYVVDIGDLRKFLVSFIRKHDDTVLDSHLSHYLGKRYVDLCIVVKCGITVLKKRLERRGYSKVKIRENLDAEIFDVCLVEATEFGHKVVVIDTTKGFRGDFNALLKKKIHS